MSMARGSWTVCARWAIFSKMGVRGGTLVLMLAATAEVLKVESALARARAAEIRVGIMAPACAVDEITHCARLGELMDTMWPILKTRLGSESRGVSCHLFLFPQLFSLKTHSHPQHVNLSQTQPRGLTRGNISNRRSRRTPILRAPQHRPRNTHERLPINILIQESVHNTGAP